MKINSRLILMVAAPIAVTLTLVSVLFFFTYRTSLDGKLQKLAVSESSLIREQVEAWIQPYFIEVRGSSYAAEQRQVTRGYFKIHANTDGRG